MKKKKSEPLKATFSFSDEPVTHDDVIDGIMALAKLACNAGIDKRLNSNKYKNDEVRIEEDISEKEISRNFLDGLDKKLREDKNLKNCIEDNIAKRKHEKICFERKR